MCLDSFCLCPKLCFFLLISVLTCLCLSNVAMGTGPQGEHRAVLRAPEPESGDKTVTSLPWSSASSSHDGDIIHT